MGPLILRCGKSFTGSYGNDFWEGIIRGKMEDGKVIQNGYAFISMG